MEIGKIGSFMENKILSATSSKEWVYNVHCETVIVVISFCLLNVYFFEYGILENKILRQRHEIYFD